MLAPRWAQLKLGPLMRGESDLRTYHNLFRARPSEVTGLRKAFLNRAVSRAGEPQDLESLPNNVSNRVITFEGGKDHFQRLNGWDQFLFEQLQSMTRKQWLSRVHKLPEIPIGMHVRRGDFTEPKSESDFLSSGSLRVPLRWFIDSLNLIRDVLAAPVRAFVVSDGANEELQPLLKTSGVTRVATGSAIGDMFALSQAKLLLASGSSFSAWSAFLGQMPAVSHPGQSLTWFQLKSRNGSYLGELDPQSPPMGLVDQIKAIA